MSHRKPRPYPLPTAHRWEISDARITFPGGSAQQFVRGEFVYLPRSQPSFTASLQLHLNEVSGQPLPGEWTPDPGQEWRLVRYVQCIAYQLVAASWLGDLRQYCEQSSLTLSPPACGAIARYGDVHRWPRFALSPRHSMGEPDPSFTYRDTFVEAAEMLDAAYRRALPAHVATVMVDGTVADHTPPVRLGYHRKVVGDQISINPGFAFAALVTAER